MEKIIESTQPIGVFVISKTLKNEIDHLHAKIGEKEWNGILLYSTDNKRGISSMSNLRFTGKHVFPMKIGTSAAAEFNYDSSVIDMYENIPEAMSLNIGLIHSHHSMATFFSNIDTDDLKSNSVHYNYYISLIVNFRGVYSCKIAFYSNNKFTNEYEIVSYNGKKIKVKNKGENKDILVFPLTVVHDIDLDKWFTDKCDAMIVENEKIIEESKNINRKWEPLNLPTSNSWNKDNSKSWSPTSWRKDSIMSSDDKSSKNIRFIKSLILGYDDDATMSLEELLELFEGIDKEEEVFFLQNVEIIHDNVFGTNSYFEENLHIQDAIYTLEKYIDEYPDIENLIKLLKRYSNDDRQPI